MHEDLTELTIRRCLEGELDVGILASSVNHELIVSEVLFTEEILLTMPLQHRLSKIKTVDLEAVAEEPFILLNEVHCLGEQILGFCNQQGCLPAIRCRSAQLLTVQELVALGHGVSLVPAMARKMDRGPRCQYRSLVAPKPTRTIHMIWHKARYQSPLVKEFLEIIRRSGR